MPKAVTTDAKISAATLNLAAAKGWPHVTIESVAKATGVSAIELRKRFKTANHLASLIATEIDREAFAGQKFVGDAHDVLFDLLMARFDILQKYRAGITAMEQSARRDRALTCQLALATMDGCYRITDIAKLKKPQRPVLALGIAAVYSFAFAAWRNDQSRDMAKTMAALDRSLRWAGRAADIVTRGF